MVTETNQEDNVISSADMQDVLAAFKAIRDGGAGGYVNIDFDELGVQYIKVMVKAKRFSL